MTREKAKETLSNLWECFRTNNRTLPRGISREIVLVSIGAMMLDIIDEYPDLSEEVIRIDALKELDELHRRDPLYRHRGW